MHRCRGTLQLVTLVAWAPMSLLFYKGTAFPAKYKVGAFIAFHGSWNRTSEPQEDFRVVFQPLANGAASGTYETFADGFAAVIPTQLQAWHAQASPTRTRCRPRWRVVCHR